MGNLWASVAANGCGHRVQMDRF